MSEDATVGIVLVSHSAALAAGTAELAGQMGGGLVRIVAAGGTDDGRLGTSVGKLRRALAQADSGAGVLILPDLGSSVLTVRAVLAEDGPEGGPEGGSEAGPEGGPERGCEGGSEGGPEGGSERGSERGSLPDRLEVADAPFVEGAVAAAVMAASGGDVKAVRSAAEEAWHARKL